MSLKHSEGFVCRKALYFSREKLHVNLMPFHYKVRVKVSKELYYKTKYMVMSRNRNAGQGHSVKIDSSSIERVEEFKYLGTTLTD